MKTVGLLIVGFGSALLVLSVAFVGWAHHMYAVGVSSGAEVVALAAIPGIVVAGLGGLLVRIGARRRNSN